MFYASGELGMYRNATVQPSVKWRSAPLAFIFVNLDNYSLSWRRYALFRFLHLVSFHFLLSMSSQMGTHSTFRGRKRRTCSLILRLSASTCGANSESPSDPKPTMKPDRHFPLSPPSFPSFLLWKIRRGAEFSILNRMLNIKALSSRNSPNPGTRNYSATREPESGLGRWS